MPGQDLTHLTEPSLSRGTGLGQGRTAQLGLPRIPVGPSAGHLNQPAQTCSEHPTKPCSSIGSKPLGKVGLPCVSLSLSLPDGKEFCDLEGHTVVVPKSLW